MIATQDNPTQYRAFHFLFVNMFLHEVGGHLLVTYLTQGRITTPPHIGTEVSGFMSSYNEGESGRYLEVLLFGGNIEFYRDPSQGNNQV